VILVSGPPDDTEESNGMVNSHHLGEFALIDWIRRREQAHPAGVWTQLGIGDDCAILDAGAHTDLLVTTDMLMDGRHFRLEPDGPESVGYKAMGVNLSDIAAMAGIPRAAVVAVALPRQTAVVVAQGLHAGMRALADRFGVELVGGDTNAWDGPLVISVTLLGQASARGAVRRAGARPGDAILVTGPLGGSLFVGRHLRPEPRIAEALALHELAPIHAMIDLSDGLSSDLGHILDESGGLGAILDASAIPIHADAAAMSLRDGVPALDHALNDGEDFELCLTLSPEDAARLLAAPPAPTRLYRVGEITDGPGLRLRTAEGTRLIEPRGFDHLRSG
jgi:thiamine-monophosphate kinase